MRTFYFLVILLFLCPFMHGQDSARVYLDAGLKQKEAGNCQSALPLFEKAIQFNPQLGEGYLELAWCHNELGQFTLALNRLSSASKWLPNDKKVLYETGFAYYNLDSINKALVLYQQVLAIDSNHILARLGLGDIYRAKRSDSRKALNWYNSVISREPNNKKAHYWAGWCHNELKEYALAQPCLLKAVALDPNDRIAYSELGYTAYSLGNFTEAISFLRKTESIPGPKIGTALYYLGLCYAKTDQKQEAIKKYNELVLMNSDLAPALLTEIRAMKQ